ncbi:acyl-[acyl-carrier-protein] thioesterase [Chitinivibrio alkaliphilus]|uniref:Acyl-ACP thioesterase n=1 Tax=Chitinivibrio alkaliphilus ACht1 TaxID=1313304 RepID=U7DBF3_9BACT|nr:acyl-ACP thioesterase domain-containing protein [Chitinivibrio alkaliphilus]ERP31755.1 acyl-ACP thioesterase [Chitinivibrio alkaliphilus ACht1]
MKDDYSLYTEKITIGYSHCDHTGLAKLPVMGSFLQDIAMRHDMLLHREVLKIPRIKHLFALVRLNIFVLERPRWKDEITISTWLQPLEGENRFVYRNFTFADRRGKEIGLCTITAFPIDLKKRKAQELPDEIKTLPTREKTLSTGENSRIRRPQKITSQTAGTVLPGDIDMYEHVNNNRYLCWAIDHSPLEIQNRYFCYSGEIQFRMELKNGQEFLCKMEITELDAGLTAVHQIVRKEDNRECARILTRWKERTVF